MSLSRPGATARHGPTSRAASASGEGLLRGPDARGTGPVEETWDAYEADGSDVDLNDLLDSEVRLTWWTDPTGVALGEFLADHGRRTFEWPPAKADRSHVHSRIDQDG